MMTTFLERLKYSRIFFSQEGPLQKVLAKKNAQVQAIHDTVMRVFDIDWSSGTKEFKKEQNELKEQSNKKVEERDNLDEELKDLVNKKGAAEEELDEIKNNIETIKVEMEEISEEISREDDCLYDAQLLNPIKLPPEFLGGTDIAQKRWEKFANRERAHEFLDREESLKVLADIASIGAVKDSEHLKRSIACCQEDLPAADNGLTDDFYQHYQQFQSEVQDQITKHEAIVYKNCNAFFTSGFKRSRKIVAELTEASTMLRNYVDVTMNAMINKKLDQYEFKSANPDNSPLIGSDVIKSWLIELSKDRTAFRSFLDQQRKENNLDQAIIRQTFIIMVVEQQQPSKEVIEKTGLQKELRRYYGSEKTLDNLGSTTNIERIDIQNFFHKCPTLDYASKRVQEKIQVVLRKDSAFKGPK